MTNEINQPGDQPIPDATAVVLAGGKSSRMGRPKSLLPFGDEPLITHIVRALQRIFSETVVVAAPEQELPSPARQIGARRGRLSGAGGWNLLRPESGRRGI